MYEYFYVAKQIERETALMNGWLKPKLLNELSGVPAAVLLCEELERKKREGRRRKGTDEGDPLTAADEAASKRVNELIKRSNSINSQHSESAESGLLSTLTHRDSFEGGVETKARSGGKKAPKGQARRRQKRGTAGKPRGEGAKGG